MSVDLSPLFGTIEATRLVDIKQPARNALWRNIEALSSKEAVTRREALRQLQFFPEFRAEVVRNVLELVNDPDARVRTMVINVLVCSRGLRPKEARKLAPLLKDPRWGDHTRRNIAWLVARYAPKEREVEKALEFALGLVEKEVRKGIQQALDYYRKRPAEK